MTHYYGLVKTFDSEKGFGFIELPDFPEEGDLFVHVSALSGDLTELFPEQEVVFDIAEGKNGPQAVNVSLQ